VIFHTQICNNINTILELKIEWQHHFLLFIDANNIVCFANNDTNQLHTKVKTKKQHHVKTYYNYIISNQKCEKKRKKKEKWNDSNCIPK